MMMITREQTHFQDRTDAGRQLSERLAAYRGNSVVFAIPNGGIPAAIEVATRLNADLDVVVIQKIRVPFDLEAGYGAVAIDGSATYSRPMAKKLGISDRDVQKQSTAMKGELNQRSLVFRGDRPFPWLVGKVAIIVDDGMSSGYTMAAAVKSVRSHRAGKVIVATPVASEPAYQIVKSFSDEMVCPFVSRSSWFTVAGAYREWNDISDADALSMLTKFRNRRLAVLANTPA